MVTIVEQPLKAPLLSYLRYTMPVFEWHALRKTRFPAYNKESFCKLLISHQILTSRILKNRVCFTPDEDKRRQLIFKQLKRGRQ
jgi:hypothetical protein